MTPDIEKLRAAGLRVKIAAGGLMVATGTMKQMQFIPVRDDKLVLAPDRSSLHRAVRSALNGELVGLRDQK